MRSLTGNKRIGLAVLCAAQFVVVLDATIVATALPMIGDDLDFTASGLPWVITAYTVVLAGLLILGGRTADLVGAARMFRAGLVVFSIASLACALAWSPAALIGARVAQGIGAALLSPAALAALGELIPGEARRQALGWWTAAAAGGGASGWVLGGLITEFAGWRWVFAVNVPIGLVALLVSTVLARSAVRPRGAATSLDVRGAVLVTVGLALGVLGLSLVSEGVTRWTTWLVIASAAVAIAWFVRVERRVERPLVPGRLLRTPGVLGGNLTAAALTGSTTPAMLTVVLYVQETLGLPPAQGALLFPAFNLAVIAGSLAGPTCLARIGIRTMLLCGFSGICGGTAILLLLPEAGLRPLLLISSFALMGLGLGVASVASTTAGLAAVDDSDRGVASGLLNSTAQLGTALGLALAVPLVASAAPMTGYRLGFVAAALIGLLGMASVVTVPRGLAMVGRDREHAQVPRRSGVGGYRGVVHKRATSGGIRMSNITQSIDVDVPVTTAYNQWTQFESFPQFMDSVEEIRQLDDTHNHWVVKVGGATREFDATVTEQHPDERVAWKSDSGPQHAGVVTFHKLTDTSTRVTAQMDIDPDGFLETVGDKLGVIEGRVKGDMERFKTFIEERGGETGAWRGDVPR